MSFVYRLPLTYSIDMSYTSKRRDAPCKKANNEGISKSKLDPPPFGNTILGMLIDFGVSRYDMRDLVAFTIFIRYIVKTKNQLYPKEV